MATYGADPDSMINTGDELRRATQAIKKELDELDIAVNNYVASNAGETARTFVQAQAAWKAGYEAMNLNLGQAAIALDDITTEIVRTDRMGAASF